MTTAADGYAHPEYLTDPAWVAAHLDDPNVVVLDLRQYRRRLAAGTHPRRGSPVRQLGEEP